MNVVEGHFTAFRSIAFASLAFIAMAHSFVSAQTLAPPQNPPSAGSVQINTPGLLATNQDLMPGVPFPAGLSQTATRIFYAIRDDVYNGAAAEPVDAEAVSLLKGLSGQQISANDQALLEARIAYLAGRSWNDHKNKKKAISWFEQAIDAANTMIRLAGETPTALVALAEPLGELCLLKDLGFLIGNGPKVGQYADKALKTEPQNIKARLLKASAFAYPPPIWGGNYRKALEVYAAILSMAEAGLPKDVLFDTRVGIATAYANLKLSEHAAWWFRAALELYPQNPYARAELEKLTQ